ncbi:MAG: lipopolysaccharide biosynthesis protein, partial [Pseudomonadota bacterium]
MSITSTPTASPLQMVKAMLTKQRVMDYGALLGGQVGRLAFSMVYFVVLARTLSLADFGLFATASSIGVVLSRVCGFGFISPLYRIATIKPALVGAYTGGLIVATLASLPLVALIGWAIHAGLYTGLLALSTFALIVAAEVLVWRTLEAAIIVNHGLNRYRTGSFLAIGGVAAKTAGAVAFGLYGSGSIDQWAVIYIGALGLWLLFALAFFYPRQRLRWTPRAWLGRTKDALGVSAAEALFYLQSEMDKVLVLALGGEVLAGLYAIVMRLVDLTATPMRAMNTMIVQWIMRARQAGGDAHPRWMVDAGIAAMSTAALLALAVLLWLIPDILGESIASASNLLWLVLLVPAFRNAIEFHTELLYAHEAMRERVFLLAGIGAAKAVLLCVIFAYAMDFSTVALRLNAAFAAENPAIRHISRAEVQS